MAAANAQYDDENGEKIKTPNEIDEDNTCYGTLVDNLDSINVDSTNETETAKLEENVETMNCSELTSSGQKVVNRSYSLESGEFLNEKYDNTPDESPSEYIQLDILPAELFLHICSFLDAKFVIKTLGHVCKSFHAMVNDETFWRVRMGQKWRNKYPAIPVRDKDFNWALACMEREEQFDLWSDHKVNFSHYNYNQGLFAPVDVVHLMKNGQLLAAGSRDRYLSLLDLSKLDPESPEESVKKCMLYSNMKAHKGWIWAMSSIDNVLLTGSWDTYIKLWDVVAEGQEMSQVKCNSAILCTHYESGCILAGAYDRKVYHIDPRTGTIIARKRYHKKPVLCMAVDQNYVITGSEDQTLAVYDRRADTILRTLQLESYPMCLSYGLDQLWLGNKSGGIQLVDASDGDFSVVETYDGIHEGKVTGLQHGLGSIFTSSTDKTIKVLQPGLQPRVITTIKEHTADIAKISFQNNILASAGSDVSIGIWMPK